MTDNPLEVVHTLGAGGMGYVFRGHDDALDRSVALKVMRPEWAANKAAKTRFLREGRAAAKLRSDHVVVIYGAGGDGPGETPFLAMEDLPGRTLDKWLAERGGAADPATVCRVARHALRGLAAAHANGLTHRDIKPSNLWVEPTGRVKVLDFGIVHDVADPKVTVTGQVLGSVAYMSKEQALGTAIDARADVYSVGVVMYQMLTGANPFNKGNYNMEVEVAPGVKMRFCWVPAGRATLGSPADEKERDSDEAEYEFTTKGFWLGKYEVTQAEWVAVTGKANPSHFTESKANPVEQVSWNDAVEFCNRASGHAGRTPRYEKDGDGWAVVASANGFRLPHEDEWEYACRGGLGNLRPFYFGAELNGTQANCDGNYPYGTATKGPSKQATCAVDDTGGGGYPAHPWGLFHMHGNVWEWCENNYDQSTDRRVVRGGSWYLYSRVCRAAFRLWLAPGAHHYFVGFRVCLPLD